jgi:threonine dehydratase
VLRTPLRRSDWLSAACGGEILLKLETLQPTGSYKIRGAFNAVLKLRERGQHGPLVTASAGNHGRALACAAAAAGMRLTVYVPEHAPQTKVEAIRRTGAELRACDSYDEAERRAKEYAAAGRAYFVSPYSHPDVIAGAGTIGLEILEDDRRLDDLIVPVGGGGLISGIAIAAKTLADKTVVIGVEAQASTPFTQSLAAGHLVQTEVYPTLADGLAGNLDPETITFDLVQRFVDGIVIVEELALRDAVRGVLIEEKLVAEGAAAAGVAAVNSGRVDLRGRRAAVVLSGGNIDPETLKSLL